MLVRLRQRWRRGSVRRQHVDGGRTARGDARNLPEKPAREGACAVSQACHGEFTFPESKHDNRFSGRDRYRKRRDGALVVVERRMGFRSRRLSRPLRHEWHGLRTVTGRLEWFLLAPGGG